MASSSSESVSKCLQRLTNGAFSKSPNKTFLAWPPDAFAVVAKMLRDSGAYVQVIQDWPPEGYSDIDGYQSKVRAAGAQWFQNLKTGANNSSKVKFTIPDIVLKLWRQIYEYKDCGYRGSDYAVEVGAILLQICAIADEASKSIATFSQFENEQHRLPWGLQQWMMDELELFFSDEEKPTNLCSSAVDRNYLTVVPKMRTPQNGITMRSLSHHLALLPNSEVQVLWYPHRFEESRLGDGINLLLFPWPNEILPTQFQKHEVSRSIEPAGNHRYFSFVSRGDSAELTSMVTTAFLDAKRRFGSIDAVIFPEMALDRAAFSQIHQRLEQEDALIMVGGIYAPPAEGRLGSNYAQIRLFADVYGSSLEVKQYKHHRWMLDGSQIRNYGIGSRLNPSQNWWEAIEIPDRKLRVVQLAPNMVLSVLICEDLARPDPVGDIIRAIGPNLLVALLQDGPQLASRWSARYATVFADDPGCSVLTLTGLGLTRLSKPPNVQQESRVIALWKQADQPARELSLPPGAEALVLCLSNEHKGQWTADGRFEVDGKGSLSLSGVHSISI